MNRRGFLSTLAAGLVLDPEQLLWKPGAKLISIPRPRLKIGDTLTFRKPARFVTQSQMEVSGIAIWRAMEGRNLFNPAINVFAQYEAHKAEIFRRMGMKLMAPRQQF